MRIGIVGLRVGGLAAGALLGLAGCGNGASAVETRDRAAEVAEARFTADSGSAGTRPSATAAAEGEKPVLTASRRETVDAKIQRLYERNGEDFGATSAEDFLDKVVAFTTRPPAGVETVKRPNGDTLLYQASSNTFAVVADNGSARTMFKPDEGPAYWAEQKAAAPAFGQRQTSN